MDGGYNDEAPEDIEINLFFFALSWPPKSHNRSESEKQGTTQRGEGGVNTKLIWKEHKKDISGKPLQIQSATEIARSYHDLCNFNVFLSLKALPPRLSSQVGEKTKEVSLLC